MITVDRHKLCKGAFTVRRRGKVGTVFIRIIAAHRIVAARKGGREINSSRRL